jgi:hypothetical protein
MAKYLAKTKMRMIFVNSVGSREIGPILYQALVPLIFGAKKKRKKSEIKQRK